MEPSRTSHYLQGESRLVNLVSTAFHILAQASLWLHLLLSSLSSPRAQPWSVCSFSPLSTPVSSTPSLSVSVSLSPDSSFFSSVLCLGCCSLPPCLAASHWPTRSQTPCCFLWEASPTLMETVRIALLFIILTIYAFVGLYTRSL